jgi:hypothetical protein
MTNTKTGSKKIKLVRDSFSLPKAEYASIDALKKRAMTMGVSAKKSELLRAGLMWLNGASDSALKAALTAVPTLKTGRPAAETPKKAAAKPVAKTSAKPAAKAAVKAAPRKAPVAQKAAAKPVAKKAAAPAKAPVSRTRAKPVAKTASKPATKTAAAA